MLLRIRAEGGRNLAKNTSRTAFLDPKPDPYLIVVYDGKTTKFPGVDNVDAAEFRWGADAVRDFPWKESLAELDLHVKDADTLVDRHIGAAKLALGPLWKELAPGVRISKDITLEFSDEKLKTKKVCGEITLTFECIDNTRKSSKADPPTAKKEPAVANAGPPGAKPEPAAATPEALVVKRETLAVGAQAPAATSDTLAATARAPTAEAEAPAAIAIVPAPKEGTTPIVATSEAKPASLPPVLASAPQAAVPVMAKPGVLEPLQATTQPVMQAPTQTHAVKADTNADSPSPTLEPTKAVAEQLKAPAAAPPTATEPTTPEAAQSEPAVPPLVTSAAKPLRVRVQAVGGRNLAPKPFVTRALDPYPDPFVTLVVGAETRVFPVLDNVKTSEFQWGADAVEEFDLPPGESSVPIALHVKDKDTAFDHYIGGTSFALDLPALMAASALTNLVYVLEYDDPSFKKKAKASRGEIFLSFFVVETVPAAVAVVAAAPAEPTKALGATPDAGQTQHRASVDSRVFKGSLQVMAHSATGLAIPPRKMLSLDRKADPYVRLTLGAATAELPQAKDGHDNPKWHNALHLFDGVDSATTEFLDVAVLDKNLLLQDEFLGGARVRLVDCLSTLTPERPGVLELPLTVDKGGAPCEAKGVLTVSLTYTPEDANRVNWTGPAIGSLDFSGLALAVSGKLATPAQELVLEVSVRRHLLAQAGFVTSATPQGHLAADSLAWPDTSLRVPYGLYLHEGMTKDKSPVVVFALKDRNAIVADRPLALGHLNLLDLLGLSVAKQVVLLSQNAKLPGRAVLSFAVAPGDLPDATGLAAAATPGLLRLFVLGAKLLAPKVSWEKLRVTLTAPARTSALELATDDVDPVTGASAIAAFNSVFELQVLPSHAAKADMFAVTATFATLKNKIIGTATIPVFQLLQRYATKDFDVEITHDNAVVCLVSCALTFEPSSCPPQLEDAAATASAVDFGPGYLHIVVVKAEGVVPENGAKIADMDPEVRLVIKPRYTKDKRVKSTAKTRSLEAVEADPTWNEYLKLEFVPSDDAATLHVPPVLALSLNEIQPPGEDTTMGVIGAGELPLAAFLPSSAAPRPFRTKVPLLRAGLPVGTVDVVGIFEALQAPEDVRKAVHAQARQLRMATPSMDAVATDANFLPGRLEVHLVHAKGLARPPHEPIACEVCVASCVEESVRVESQTTDTPDGALVWDRQLTLFTQTAVADCLRLDLFLRAAMIGYIKVPLSTYSLAPRKAFKEYHDVVLKAKTKDAAPKPQAPLVVLLELAFFPDQALQTFVHKAARGSEKGTFYVKLDALEPTAPDLAAKKLALRCTLLFQDDPAANEAITFPFKANASPKIAFGDVLGLTCPDNYTLRSTALGSCPLLRLELINGSSAFGKEAISADEIAIQSLLLHPLKVLSKRLPLSTIAPTPMRLGYVRLQLVYVPDTPGRAQPIEYFTVGHEDDAESSALLPLSGTLSLRAIAGRNLEEVDALGEQDPYLQLRTLPESYGPAPTFAQSSVCLNSGRHPVWNSAVFALAVRDVYTDVVSIAVLDSGQEDHVPDALIGDTRVAVVALVAAMDERTHWSEGWFPIFSRGADAGQVRLEYRFVPDDDARIQAEAPTKYTNCAGGCGTLHARLLRARHLPCTSGMRPAVRMVVEKATFTFVTKGEKKAIVHPTFDEATACPVAWAADLNDAVLVRFQIVDLGAQVASTSLPVLAQCSVNVAPFVVHPGEAAKGWYPLSTFQVGAAAVEIPAIEVALQFIPKDDSTTVAFADLLEVVPPGQAHVRIVEAAFRSNSVTTPAVHVTLGDSTKATAPYMSAADEYARCAWNESLLFDCAGGDDGQPRLALDARGLAESFGALELPLFPFVLAKGHLSSAWYPLYAKNQVAAQVKIEVQYLKTHATKPPPPDLSFLSIEVVEGRHLRSAQDGDDAQDPFVELTFLSQTVQTKPHVDGGSDPVWHETFELSLDTLETDRLPTLAVAVRNADAKKHGTGVIGTCHWVVPKDVLADGKLRDVIIKLTGSSDGVDVRDVTDGNGDIQLRLKRGKLPSLNGGEVNALTAAGEASGESGRANPAGVLYVFSRAPPIEAAASMTIAVECEDRAPEVAFSLADIGVVRVPGRAETLQRHLPRPEAVFVLKTQGGAVHLSADYLQTVLATPTKEFRDVHPLVCTTPPASPVAPVDLSLIYIKPVQGQLKVAFTTVDNVSLTPGTAYYVEVRVLRNSPWSKSPTVKATAPAKLAWKPHGHRELTYSNYTEVLPPQLQVVLFATDTDSAVKVAFAQVSLLKYVVSSGELFPDDIIPLTCVASAKERPALRVSIGFVANPTAQATPPPAETLQRAVDLAEGTAELKKAFLLLGGDATVPVAIHVLKSHALERDKCLHVLTHAAEASGGLDALFAAMDTNKDGCISWDEYLDCMQTVHCLADEALAKPSAIAAVQPVDSSDDEEDDAPVNNVKDDDEVDALEVVEVPKSAPVTPTVLPWTDFKPLAPVKAPTVLPLADDDEAPSPGWGQRRQAPPPMVPVAKPAAAAVTAVVVPSPAPKVVCDERSLPQWKVADVQRWLEHVVELPQYSTSFGAASVDGSLLLTLTEDDLSRQLGVAQPLHLRKLLARIEALQDKHGFPAAPRTRANRAPRATATPMPALSTTAAVADDGRLHEMGVNGVERSKLEYKLKDARVKAKRPTGEKRLWTFEYTGQPPPTAPPTALERIAGIIAADEAKSAFEGAMDQVLAQVVPVIPLLRVPLVANADETLEILKQALWRFGQECVRRERDRQQQEDDAASDFGDDPGDAALAAASDATDVVAQAFYAFTRLQNNGARWLHDNAANDTKLSRLKFQGGLRSLLNIELSWHQFDILFRRLDRRRLGDLVMADFRAAFGDAKPGSGLSNDMRVVNEALTLMVERLEAHNLTLLQAWQAFDRDNSGAVSPAEFGTLVRFLTHVEGRDDLTKHQVFLMLGALDTSCDRRIQQGEFMRFIFIVWSHRLMQLQQYVAAHETAYHAHTESPEFNAHFDLIAHRKAALRKALRQNFSRPFRDAMRCAPVAVPGPFQNLLEKLHLQPAATPNATQVWEVLQGSHGATTESSMPPPPRPKKKSKTNKNQLLTTKLTRQRGPERSRATLQMAPAVNLDQAQRLTFDRKAHAYK
ncbi:hypothetical protein ACHHYP_08325 [Achlya hypogyna]|uniref:Uncharacterized protein n=1 Tax=Achlya hypogyna TaxID=1202772 RepID=A0A1V9ZKU8_ACHHY|nr:hypothetical protein ACHHYP_08325 [Achlya hypogyna]